MGAHNAKQAESGSTSTSEIPEPQAVESTDSSEWKRGTVVTIKENRGVVQAESNSTIFAFEAKNVSLHDYVLDSSVNLTHILNTGDVVEFPDNNMADYKTSVKLTSKELPDILLNKLLHPDSLPEVFLSWPCLKCSKKHASGTGFIVQFGPVEQSSHSCKVYVAFNFHIYAVNVENCMFRDCQLKSSTPVASTIEIAANVKVKLICDNQHTVMKIVLNESSVKNATELQKYLQLSPNVQDSVNRTLNGLSENTIKQSAHVLSQLYTDTPECVDRVAELLFAYALGNPELCASLVKCLMYSSQPAAKNTAKRVQQLCLDTFLLQQKCTATQMFNQKDSAQFLSELYNNGLMSSVHACKCIEKLLKPRDNTDLECLCMLFEAIVINKNLVSENVTIDMHIILKYLSLMEIDQNLSPVLMTRLFDCFVKIAYTKVNRVNEYTCTESTNVIEKYFDAVQEYFKQSLKSKTTEIHRNEEATFSPVTKQGPDYTALNSPGRKTASVSKQNNLPLTDVHGVHHNPWKTATVISVTKDSGSVRHTEGVSTFTAQNVLVEGCTLDRHVNLLHFVSEGDEVELNWSPATGLVKQIKIKWKYAELLIKNLDKFNTSVAKSCERCMKDHVFGKGLVLPFYIISGSHSNDSRVYIVCNSRIYSVYAQHCMYRGCHLKPYTVNLRKLIENDSAVPVQITCVTTGSITPVLDDCVTNSADVLQYLVLPPELCSAIEKTLHGLSFLTMQQVLVQLKELPVSTSECGKKVVQLMLIRALNQPRLYALLFKSLLEHNIWTEFSVSEVLADVCINSFQSYKKDDTENNEDRRCITTFICKLYDHRVIAADDILKCIKKLLKPENSIELECLSLLFESVQQVMERKIDHCEDTVDAQTMLSHISLSQVDAPNLSPNLLLRLFKCFSYFAAVEITSLCKQLSFDNFSAVANSYFAVLVNEFEMNLKMAEITVVSVTKNEVIVQYSSGTQNTIPIGNVCFNGYKLGDSSSLLHFTKTGQKMKYVPGHPLEIKIHHWCNSFQEDMIKEKLANPAEYSFKESLTACSLCLKPHHVGKGVIVQFINPEQACGHRAYVACHFKIYVFSNRNVMYQGCILEKNTKLGPFFKLGDAVEVQTTCNNEQLMVILQHVSDPSKMWKFITLPSAEKHRFCLQLNELSASKLITTVECFRDCTLSSIALREAALKVVFEKALKSCPHHALLCDFLMKLESHLNISVGKTLLKFCNEEFLLDWKTQTHQRMQSIRDNNTFNEESKRNQLEDLKKNRENLRIRYLLNCRFAAELYKVHILPIEFMDDILSTLLQTPTDVDDLDCACVVLTIAGPRMEEELMKGELEDCYMEEYFIWLHDILKENDLPESSKFNVTTVIQLRDSGWGTGAVIQKHKIQNTNALCTSCTPNHEFVSGIITQIQGKSAQVKFGAKTFSFCAEHLYFYGLPVLDSRRVPLTEYFSIGDHVSARKTCQPVQHIEVRVGDWPWNPITGPTALKRWFSKPGKNSLNCQEHLWKQATLKSRDILKQKTDIIAAQKKKIEEMKKLIETQTSEESFDMFIAWSPLSQPDKVVIDAGFQA